ncbi:MAG: elongation factor Ts [Immundisolibacteraceae bacterium]|nr:elongation factor Ts [Immundisolibacteraceae bacterium]
MAISAQMVKEMRERTGLGMMECKKALVAADGDIDVAIESMRKSGQARADKKANRIAAEGRVAVSSGAESAVLIEINCETDFVGKDVAFIAFCDALAAVSGSVTSVEELLAATLADGASVEETRQQLILTIGENIQIRRMASLSGNDATYGHYSHGGSIGVIVQLEGGDLELARDIAMHIAAANPACISEAEVDADVLAKEREIYLAQAADSGKPEAIQEKMVDGRIRKYVAEITLLGQAFVKDPDLTIGKLVDKAGAKVTGFVRYQVGEGIEKKSEDFVAEVMKQAQSSAD